MTAVALGEANTRDRDYGDLYRLITAHDLSGADVIAALNRTAIHRGVSLRPLSTSIPTLASRRQSSYSAWRRKQGRDGASYPENFADVVTIVAAFADPVLAGMAIERRWDHTREVGLAGEGTIDSSVAKQ